jgi:hypothetical protein
MRCGRLTCCQPSRSPLGAALLRLLQNGSVASSSAGSSTHRTSSVLSNSPASSSSSGDFEIGSRSSSPPSPSLTQTEISRLVANSPRSAISGGMNASMKASQFRCSHWMTIASFIVDHVGETALVHYLRPQANTRRSAGTNARYPQNHNLLMQICKV